MERVTWNLRVISDQRNGAKAYVRQHEFEVGSPLHFDPEYPRITALEYVLGAIGADLVNGFYALSRRRRLVIDDMEVLVQGQVEEPLVYLGVVGAEGSPALDNVLLKIFIGTLEEPEEVRRVWTESLVRSPLYRTFEKSVRLELNVQILL